MVIIYLKWENYHYEGLVFVPLSSHYCVCLFLRMWLFSMCQRLKGNLKSDSCCLFHTLSPSFYRCACAQGPGAYSPYNYTDVPCALLLIFHVLATPAQQLSIVFYGVGKQKHIMPDSSCVTFHRCMRLVEEPRTIKLKSQFFFFL